MSSTMARPTPTSAAATVMMNRANTWPVIAVAVPPMKPKAMKLMLTALRISSIDMRTSTPFFRASTPYTPMANKAAPRRRHWLSSTGSVPPCQDDGADEGGEEKHRHDLERDEVGREDGVTDGVGATRLVDRLRRLLELR